MPSIPIKAFNTYPTAKPLFTYLRPSTPYQSTLHPNQALHTHPWSSRYSLAVYTPIRTPIPTLSHSSENLHTHQSLQYISQGFNAHLRPYPSQVLITLLKPFTPISGLSHQSRALHTHLRASTPTQSHSYASKELHCPSLPPHHPSLVFYTYPTPSSCKTNGVECK